jgi:hypothetical protein
MAAINSNIVTASKLIRRAMQIADVANTDFLSYEEQIDYLNATFKNVYQNIIQYNLNVFTVETTLVGSAGVYPLPWDCYQIKSVKNPITGIEIPRKADSESLFGSTYEIVNNTIRLGPSVGPVTITYWRKPFFLSVPDKTIETIWRKKESEIISSCKDAILVKDRTTNAYSIISLLTDSKLELPISPDNGYTQFTLGNNFIVAVYPNGGLLYYNVLDFEGNIVFTGSYIANYIIKGEDGMVYFGIKDQTDEKFVHIYYPDNVHVTDIHFPEVPVQIVCIDGMFYPLNFDGGWVAPIGLFDGRPAFTTARKLHLINEAFDRSKDIVEDVPVPCIGQVIGTKYGFLTFDGKLYSNVPDTELDFPNNIYYDCIAYDLAVRFLCKMNADSTGVEALNQNAWTQLTSSIDQSADYPRIKLVRR